jgi:pimeloyl-ACP methyl ester carboxylesterase
VLPDAIWIGAGTFLEAGYRSHPATSSVAIRISSWRPHDHQTCGRDAHRDGERAIESDRATGGVYRRLARRSAEISVFDGLQAQLAASRAQFYYDLPAGPFYGYNRPGAKPSQGVIWNWWRQGMTGGATAHYDGLVAFSQTDFTEDLKQITVPVLVMHGYDDQIVPYADSAPLSAKLLRNSTLKTYHGFPHGMPTTESETINADLLTFLRA